MRGDKFADSVKSILQNYPLNKIMCYHVTRELILQRYHEFLIYWAIYKLAADEFQIELKCEIAAYRLD